jgi:hypothetical protein
MMVKYLISVLVLLHYSLAFAQYEGGSGRQEALGSSVILQLNDGQVAVASQLIYTTNPDPTFAIHQTINTLNLEYRTANGQIAFFETGNVVLTFQTNPGSATLLGTTTSTPINGLVSFSGLGVSDTASGYELLASGAGGTSAISSAYDVIQGGAGLGFFDGGSGRQDAMADVSSGLGTLSGQVFWVGGLGVTPTAWNDPLNWFPNTLVPDQNARLALEPNNNGHNPILDQNRTVNSLNFNGANKKVELGNYTLTLTADATGVNSNNYFKTNGSGKLKRLAIPNNEGFTFPVGNSAYNPISITNRTGTPDDFSVRVLDEIYEYGTFGNPNTEPRVKRTWDIDKLNPTANADNGVDFAFNWNSNEVSNPAPSNYTLFHHDANGNGWGQVVTGTRDPNFNPAANSMIWTGYKGSFSPFGVGDQNAPLPVELLYFTAECKPQGTALRWATASEVNSAYFELQRSDNMIDWTLLKTIPALGFHSSTYHYPEVLDTEPSQATRYYRLKQVDFDGKHEYFQAVAAFCPGSATAISLYPNPAAEQLHIQGAQAGDPWEILDMTGRRIRTGTIGDQPLHRISILDLPAGLYRIHVSTTSFPFVTRP